MAQPRKKYLFVFKINQILFCFLLKIENISSEHWYLYIDSKLFKKKNEKKKKDF